MGVSDLGLDIIMQPQTPSLLPAHSVVGNYVSRLGASATAIRTIGWAVSDDTLSSVGELDIGASADLLRRTGPHLAAWGAFSSSSAISFGSPKQRTPGDRATDDARLWSRCSHQCLSASIDMRRDHFSEEMACRVHSICPFLWHLGVWCICAPIFCRLACCVVFTSVAAEMQRIRLF